MSRMCDYLNNKYFFKKILRMFKNRMPMEQISVFSGNQPCQHLYFRLLASRTMKEYISVVLSQKYTYIHTYKKINNKLNEYINKCQIWQKDWIAELTF